MYIYNNAILILSTHENNSDTFNKNDFLGLKRRIRNSFKKTMKIYTVSLMKKHNVIDFTDNSSIFNFNNKLHTEQIPHLLNSKVSDPLFSTFLFTVNGSQPYSLRKLQTAKC